MSIQRYHLSYIDNPAPVGLIIHTSSELRTGHFIVNHHHAQITYVASTKLENDLTILNLIPATEEHISPKLRHQILQTSLSSSSELIVGIMPDGKHISLDSDINFLDMNSSISEHHMANIFWDISNPHRVRTFINLEMTRSSSHQLAAHLTKEQLESELKEARKMYGSFRNYLRIKFMKILGAKNFSKRHFLKTIPSNIVNFLGELGEVAPVPYIGIIWSKIMKKVSANIIAKQIKKETALFKSNAVHPYVKMQEVTQYTINDLTADVAVDYWQTMSAYADALEPSKENAFKQRQIFLKWYVTHQAAHNKIKFLKEIIDYLHLDLMNMEETFASKLKNFHLPKASQIFA